MLVVSTFPRLTDTKPTRHEIARFRDLCSILGRHAFAPPRPDGKTPHYCRGFSPAEYAAGATRGQDGALRAHFMVCDIDGRPDAAVSAFLAKLEGVESIVYTTFSYDRKPGVSLRVIFALDRPVEAHEYKAFWRGVNYLSGEILDDTTDDWSKFYYCPVAPVGSASHRISYFAGEPIEVADVLAHAPAEKHATRTVRRAGKSTDLDAAVTVGDDELKDVIKRLKRADTEYAKKTAEALDRLRQGLTYADENRDSMLYAMAGAIAEFYPNADPEAIACLFDRSISATNAQLNDGDDDRDHDKVVEKYGRLARDKIASIEAARITEQRERQVDLADAWRGIGINRDTPYTPEELAAFGDMTKRWIVKRGNSAYIYVNGEYHSPVPLDDLAVAARRDLSPAATAGVSVIEYAEDNTPVVLSPRQIAERYGTVARRTTIDLSAQKSTYDAATQEITEAPIRIRTEIVPRFVPRVDEWLRALAGNQYPALVQWISHVTNLKIASLIVFFDGPAGIGKSLFAKGLARIWTKAGATELKDLVEKFNDAVLYCPIVLTDEGMPAGMTTKRLREIQQNTTRKLNRKNLPIANMIGAVRLILAANKTGNMIGEGEELDNDDRKAIADRMLYIKTDDTAAKLIESWGGQPEAQKIIDDDLLAAHALYLVQNRGASSGSRFLVAANGEANELSRSVMGGSADVAHWLTMYLRNPKPYHAGNNFAIFIRDGKLHVNVSALIQSWDIYATNIRPPKARFLSRALHGISEDEKRQARILGRNTWFYVVVIDRVIAFAEDTGLSSREEITKALSKNTALPSNPQEVIAIPPPQPTERTPGTVVPIRIPSPSKGH